MVFLCVRLRDHLRSNERESKVSDNGKELQKGHDGGVPAKLFRSKIAGQNSQCEDAKKHREGSA